MVNIITRAEWGAAAPTARLTAVGALQRTAAMIHHTTGAQLGKKDPRAWLRSIQRFHQGAKGWTDIGYNLLVDDAGRVYEGRGLDVQGAHCTGWNVPAYGVAYLGDGDQVTAAARVGLRAAVELLDARSRRQLRRMGHRDGKPTGCPSDTLYAWVHAGLPVHADAAPVGDGATAVVPPVRPVPAPKYPLPRGAYFGPHGGPATSRSGYARASDRAALAAWQARAQLRTWDLGPGGADGLYGARGQTDPAASYTGRVALGLQRQAGITADGLIGPATWALPWTLPWTP